MLPTGAILTMALTLPCANEQRAASDSHEELHDHMATRFVGHAKQADGLVVVLLVEGLRQVLSRHGFTRDARQRLVPAKMVARS